MKLSRKGQSVQDMIGIKSFTDYGLATNRGELFVFPRCSDQYLGAVKGEHRNENLSFDDGAVLPPRH